MLPSAHRLVRSADFASTVRQGRRVRRGDVIVHQRAASDMTHVPIERPHHVLAAAPRVGLVVGRSVGGSVVRHRVSRRLRALMAQRLSVLPDGSSTVIRALPGSASASSAALALDLDAALARLVSSRVAGR